MNTEGKKNRGDSFIYRTRRFQFSRPTHEKCEDIRGQITVLRLIYGMAGKVPTEGLWRPTRCACVATEKCSGNLIGDSEQVVCFIVFGKFHGSGHNGCRAM